MSDPEALGQPNLLPEPDPISQELVKLERQMLDPRTDEQAYQAAGDRIREINDMQMGRPGTLQALSNERLTQIYTDKMLPPIPPEIRHRADVILERRTLPLKRHKPVPRTE